MYRQRTCNADVNGDSQILAAALADGLMALPSSR
jgi:hypothetical protein